MGGMDEMVDIVDEANNVLAQATKSEAHTRGLLHRCIIAEVIDSQGNWTLVKQASDRQDAGQYVSPVGGHIQAGESEEDALRREVFEEMGITRYTSRRIGQAMFNREVIGRNEHHYFILYEVYSDQKPMLNHESVGFKKFNVESLKTALDGAPARFGDAFLFVARTFYSDVFRLP